MVDDDDDDDDDKETTMMTTKMPIFTTKTMTRTTLISDITDTATISTGTENKRKIDGGSTTLKYI